MLACLQEGELTTRELAESINAAPPNLVKQMAALEKKDWLYVTGEVPTEGRGRPSKLYALSRTGNSILEEFRGLINPDHDRRKRMTDVFDTYARLRSDHRLVGPGGAGSLLLLEKGVRASSKAAPALGCMQPEAYASLKRLADRQYLQPCQGLKVVSLNGDDWNKPVYEISPKGHELLELIRDI